MKSLLVAALLACTATQALAASDCILDNCADQRPSPGEPSVAPAPDAPAPRQWPGPRRGGGAPSGDFDFYVLALSWSPAFCATGGSQRSSAQCAPGANPGFVTHGLWPQYQNGYPSRCGGDGFLPFSVLSGLGDLYPDQGLARHEWRQHGLCSGKSPSGYFADVRAARDGVAIPQAFKGPQEDREVSPLDIQRAFIDANPRLRPGMMAVVCRRGTFQEARFCLSRDLRAFVACPEVVRQGCRSQSIVMPAAQ
ncbi:ribonuclease T2 [Rhodoblastus sp. 17X3]|uniref:ribonuclease T2 n=1 Tax=Rhodoblastus sp. 17X3 TaxID=3047026 RepID=UPI0024B770CB|nr:ribonuclease T2 [Rhodoblastus sp. 17X3]MDI9846853.1 ribonuclease T2 [Rhodoblastus sp. 17X3]